MNDNKLPQIYSETPTPPVVLPAAQRDTYAQPQNVPAPLIPAQAFGALQVVPSYVQPQPTYTVKILKSVRNKWAKTVSKKIFIKMNQQTLNKLTQFFYQLFISHFKLFSKKYNFNQNF